MNAACDDEGTNTQLAAGAEEEGEGAAVAQHLTEGEAVQRHDGNRHERLRVTARGEDDGDGDGSARSRRNSSQRVLSTKRRRQTTVALTAGYA